MFDFFRILIISLINKVIILTIFSITTIHVQILFQNLVEPKSFHKKILNDITNEEILEVIEKFGEYFDPNDYEMLHFFIEFNRNEKLNDNF